MESATLNPPRREHGLPARLRAAPAHAWARVAFGLLCAGAMVGYLVYPTYPNYDSAYSLLWGRELLDGTLPSLDAYRAPTQHPLAIVVGAVLSPLGGAAPRVRLAPTPPGLRLLGARVYRPRPVALAPGVRAGAGAPVLS